MTVEEKKKTLKRYGETDDKIEQLRRAKENSKFYDRYQSPDFNEEIKGSGSKGSIVEITVEKRNEDWDAFINEELHNLYDLRIKIEKAVATLSDFTQQRLLRLLYLGEIDEYGDRKRFTFAEISQILSYSERQIYRIYKNALINLPDIN